MNIPFEDMIVNTKQKYNTGEAVVFIQQCERSFKDTSEFGRTKKLLKQYIDISSEEYKHEGEYGYVARIKGIVK